MFNKCILKLIFIICTSTGITFSSYHINIVIRVQRFYIILSYKKQLYQKSRNYLGF